MLLLHEPVPVIKTLKGSPPKGSGLFLSRAAMFQRSFDAAEGRLWTAAASVFGRDEIIQRLSLSFTPSLCVFIIQDTFCAFSIRDRSGWVRGDETALKEATVLISSEGCLLFFPHPFLS